MKLFKANHKKCVVAIGNFDGVHLAHQEIIKKCLSISSELQRPVVILTFDPHPTQVLYPEKNLKLIITSDAKRQLLTKMGVSDIITIPFSKDFSKITAGEFVSDTLVEKLNVSHVVSGHNFYFGHNREGDTQFLADSAKKYGFHYSSINQTYREYLQISSSKIREFLKLGAVNIVSDLLGRRYTISGKVIRGKAEAVKLGFKTANIELNNEIVYPCYGVYSVRISCLGSHFTGIANIGLRPTYSESITPVLETHIFNFDQDIYGHEITVEFLDFIRPERKFKSLEDLKYQICRDMMI